MKETPDILEILKKDVIIPENVKEKAEYTLKRINSERLGSRSNPDGERKLKKNKYHRKKAVVFIAAAVLAISAVTAVAAVLRWSESLSNGLQMSEKQMEDMANNGMNTFVGQSCEDSGVMITAVQSITDNYYTYLAFRIEGYEIGVGEEPAIENVNVTVDGNDDFNWSAGFWDGTISNNEGEPVTVDGERLKIDENGRVIMNYVMDDGSMEYRMILFNNDERGYFLNKPIHVEIENLGTYQKTDYIPGIEGRWSFDWTLGGADDTLVFEPDTPLGDSEATVKQMEISPLSLMVEYDFPRQEIGEEFVDENGDIDTFTRFAEPPEAMGVRLKDGTVIKFLYGGPGGGGYRDDNSDVYVSLLAADRVIYPEQIESVLFLEPSDEYRGGLTEDDFYEIPLNNMK